MNGDEALSNLRSGMCRNADVPAVGFDELEMLVHRWATAQNKAPLAEFAQAMANCGADTWGDVREFDKEILTDNIGMNVLDAKRFAKFLESAQHEPVEGEAEPEDSELVGSVDSSRSEDEEEDEEVIISAQSQEEGDSVAEQELEEALEEALQAVQSEEEGTPLEEEEEEEIEDDLYDHEDEQALHDMLQQQEEQVAAAALQALQGDTGLGDAAPAARVRKATAGVIQPKGLDKPKI